MARPLKTDPFEEGSLKEIYEKFFHNMVSTHCPVDKSHKEFLEDIFDIDHRHIKLWLTKRPFNMPGLYCQTGNIKIQGIGWRKVGVGASLLSRFDDRNPKEIQVSFFGGHGSQELVYSLTEEEWSWVQFHLDLVKEE